MFGLDYIKDEQEHLILFFILVRTKWKYLVPVLLIQFCYNTWIRVVKEKKRKKERFTDEWVNEYELLKNLNDEDV